MAVVSIPSFWCFDSKENEGLNSHLGREMIFKIAYGVNFCLQKLSQANFSESIDLIGGRMKYVGNPSLFLEVLKLDAKVN